jgi:hypothetical protein
MAALWKNLLLALLIAGASLYLALAVRTAAHLKEADAPKATGLLRIPELFELWNETLGYALFGLALLGGAWLIGRAPWGLHTVWNGESWTQVSTRFETASGFVVHEPGESWKANLFYGCILGLPFGLPAIFMDGKWTLARAFWVAIGMGLFLWMVQSAVENYSRTVRISDAGLEERSLFGSRRVPWEQIGELEFRDVRARIQQLQDWKTRRSSTLPRIDVWAVKDRSGRELLSLPDGMEPRDAFLKMREQIKQRAPSR